LFLFNGLLDPRKKWLKKVTVTHFGGLGQSVFPNRVFSSWILCQPV